jgi:hypothetical protein
MPFFCGLQITIFIPNGKSNIQQCSAVTVSLERQNILPLFGVPMGIHPFGESLHFGQVIFFMQHLQTLGSPTTNS